MNQLEFVIDEKTEQKIPIDKDQKIEIIEIMSRIILKIIESEKGNPNETI